MGVGLARRVGARLDACRARAVIHQCELAEHVARGEGLDELLSLGVCLGCGGGAGGGDEGVELARANHVEVVALLAWLGLGSGLGLGLRLGVGLG